MVGGRVRSDYSGGMALKVKRVVIASSDCAELREGRRRLKISRAEAELLLGLMNAERECPAKDRETE